MIKLMYAGVCLDCSNYNVCPHPVIEEKFLEKEEVCEVHPRVNKLIFVLEGEILYSMGQSQGYGVHCGQGLFLPANRSLSVHTVQRTHLIIFWLYNKIQMFDCFRRESPQAAGQGMVCSDEKIVGQNVSPFLLEINQMLKCYLETLCLCHEAGLKCRYYHDIKVRELMFILQVFYSKEDMCRFFAPVLTTDIWFSQFIMNNYSKYSKLSDLAAAMNYSVSGFEKKFRKVFSCAPYHWMRQQRAQEIYHCINASDMTLKEIISVFGFSSHPAFIKFVRQNFGKPPGQIRKTNRKAETCRICV